MFYSINVDTRTHSHIHTRIYIDDLPFESCSAANFTDIVYLCRSLLGGCGQFAGLFDGFY